MTYANNADPDQTATKGVDQGLHCLHYTAQNNNPTAVNFLLRLIPFQVGLDVQKSNQGPVVQN